MPKPSKVFSGRSLSTRLEVLVELNPIRLHLLAENIRAEEEGQQPLRDLILSQNSRRPILGRLDMELMQPRDREDRWTLPAQEGFRILLNRKAS